MGLIQADNNVFYIITPSPGSKILKSYDQCSTWEILPDLMIGSTNYSTYLGQSLIQAADRKIYVGGAWQDYNGGYVFRSGYVISNACIITPNLQGSIKQWVSFSKSDVLNGGAINYNFVSSSNAGATWSSWLPLSDANLQNVVCQGNGKDLIKVQVILYSLKHNATPQVNWINLQYVSGDISSLNNVVIAPNPFKPGSQNSSITFYNLTSDAVIKVYSITGRLINTLNANVNKCVWDTRDSHGKLLPVGMYTCYISNSQGEKKYLQLMIQR